MKFIFTDKNPVETDIIIDILSLENIPYKVIEQHTSIISMPFVQTEIITYNIECNTTLEYFDFVKQLAYDKIKQLNKLENCYIKRCRTKVKKEVENA